MLIHDLLLLAADLVLELAIGIACRLHVLAHLGECGLIGADLVGQGLVRRGQVAVVRDVGQGVGQRMGREDLLEERSLVGLVGRGQPPCQDGLADVQLALLGVLDVGELNEPQLEEDLLGR